MKGRIALVTGSTSGIGRATALGLARAGATVVLGCRDRGRGEEAAHAITTAANNPDIHVVCGDLSSRRGTRELAEEFKRRFAALHVLVNNAGAIFPSRQVSEEGVEMTFALNHLGYFHLTHLLLDLLRTGSPSRIVNVASETHRYVRLNFDDLENARRYKSVRAYALSKLGNVLFSQELARRLNGSGITVNALHPGGIRTKIYASAGGTTALYYKLFGRSMLTPERGAESVIHLAAAPEVEGLTGEYFKEMKLDRPSRYSLRRDVAVRLWDVSEEFVRSAGG